MSLFNFSLYEKSFLMRSYICTIAGYFEIKPSRKQSDEESKFNWNFDNNIILCAMWNLRLCCIWK